MTVETYARRLIRDVDYWREQPLDSRLGSALIGIQQRLHGARRAARARGRGQAVPRRTVVADGVAEGLVGALPEQQPPPPRDRCSVSTSR
jgi:hypothetical protein